MTATRRFSQARFVLACNVALLMALSGCSSMYMAKHQMTSYCAKRGERAFIKEASQNGVPVVLDFGSTIVAICYSDEDIVHFADLGIDVIPLGESKPAKGVGVVSVSPRSIADKAGLRVGDIIAEYAGKTIEKPAELRAAVEKAAGQAVTLKLLREQHDLSATIQF